MSAAKRLRVAVITSAFPLHSEAYAGVEFRVLRAAGAEVSVYTLRPCPPGAAQLLSEWQLNEIAVHYCTFRSYMSGLLFSLRKPRQAAGAWWWLARHGWRTPQLLARCALLMPRMFSIYAEITSRSPEIVHLFWGHYPAVIGYLLHRWHKNIGLSVSLTAYDLVLDFKPSLAVCGIADSVWTQAEYNACELRRLGVQDRKLFVAAHGVDLDELPDTAASRERGKVVTVARLVPEKGVDRVLRAFAAAHASSSIDMRLTILGDGSERASLERLAIQLGVETRVLFRGNVAHAEVYRELSAADVFMLLSNNPSERLPNVVKEAMASRCICIVSQTPGIDELVRGLSIPLVVPAHDWGQAAEHLARVVTNAEIFQEDRESGRRHVIAKFSAQAVARCRMQIWSETVRCMHSHARGHTV